MQIPQLPLPHVEIPFEVPFLVHPFVVHFVVALPIIVLLIELFNLAFKSRAIGAINTFLIFLLVIAMGVAIITGDGDSKRALDLMNPDTKAILMEHKRIAVLAFYFVGLLLILKLLNAIFQRASLKIIYLIILIFSIVIICNAGKVGGELVYKYGVNVKVETKEPQKNSNITTHKEEIKKEANNSNIEDKNNSLHKEE